MIAKAEVMTLLLQACPSFAAPWKAHIESEYRVGDEQLLYVDLGAFARHVVDLYEQGRTEELGPIFDMIERLHRDGNVYVREAATIGLVEGIQNIASHRFDPEAFTPFLGPETAKWWHELNAFWQGKRRWVGEGLEEVSTDRKITSGFRFEKGYNEGMSFLVHPTKAYLV
jgi:hypothetical protein